MKRLLVVALLWLLSVAPLLAQEKGGGPKIPTIDLPGITMKHEFNFVCTQNSVNSEEYFSRFNFFKDVRFANSN